MKKLLTAILVMALVMMTTACAGQAGVEDNTARSADKKSVLYFDAASAGWENASRILLYLSDLDSGDSEKFTGKRGDNSLWSFVTSDAGVRVDHVYTVAFRREDTEDETYPLLLDTLCFGDTAYADNCVNENPADDNKKLYEVRWKKSSLGPMLRITSIGNIVGEMIPANTSAYRMLVDFLASREKGGLSYALQRNGKTPQLTINFVAAALNLTKEDVVKAIEEAKTIGHSVTGEKTDWSRFWNPNKYFGPAEADKNGAP